MHWWLLAWMTPNFLVRKEQLLVPFLTKESPATQFAFLVTHLLPFTAQDITVPAALYRRKKRPGVFAFVRLLNRF
jgi:hypothetical protein